MVGDFLFSSYHVALLFSAGIGTGEANNHITSERHIHFGSLNMVEKQSQYSFLYNKNEVDVSKTVTLSLKKASMKETLNKLFAHSNITYEFDRNYVILKKVKKTVSRKTVKGRITDKHGEPMAGATITDKDGKTGVISDMDGNL